MNSNRNELPELYLLGQVVMVVGMGPSGLAIAKALCAAGAEVIAVDPNQETLEMTTDLLNRSGGKVCGFAVDPSEREPISRLVENIARDYGRIDTLINAWECFEPRAAVEVRAEEWQNAVRIHIKGVFLACQAVGRVMLQRGSGCIINLSSVAGSLGFSGCVAFAACKGGVEQLTRTLGVEWAGRGVRVNAIAGWSDGLREKELSSRGARTPMGDLPQSAALLGTVVYLATAASSAVTGQIIYVDGGYCAQ